MNVTAISSAIMPGKKYSKQEGIFKKTQAYLKILLHTREPDFVLMLLGIISTMVLFKIKLHCCSV